jgi:hypothetical protein
MSPAGDSYDGSGANTMSAYEHKLREMIATDGREAAAAWFIEMLAKQKILTPDLSEMELKFFLEIVHRYEEWLKDRWQRAN